MISRDDITGRAGEGEGDQVPSKQSASVESASAGALIVGVVKGVYKGIFQILYHLKKQW